MFLFANSSGILEEKIFTVTGIEKKAIPGNKV